MKSIKNFIKEYKWYIVIGILIGLVVAALVLIFGKRGSDLNQTEIEKIESPFSVHQEEFLLNVNNSLHLINENTQIFQLSKPSQENVENIAEKFISGDLKYENPQYPAFWEDNGDIVTYDNITGIMHIISKNGILLDMKINSINDLTIFFQEYFDILDIEILITKEIDRGLYEYEGVYIYEDIPWGSIHLSGNAFKLVVSENQNLISLSFLFYNSEIGLIKYQKMPTLSSLDILSFPSYPSYIIKNTNNERFLEQYPIIQASAILTAVEIEKLEKVNIFTDNEYGYIFPAYRMLGTGTLEDSQDNEYLSGVEIYYSAISPEFLLEKTLIEEDLYDPAPQ